MTNTKLKNQTIVAKQERYTIGYVTSKDGIKIGYRQYGQGPALVLMQGTMGTAHNFNPLSEALAEDFTVYVPDRRGRGLSSHVGNDYSIQKEVEDLDALLAKTGAHNVFGLSSGAIISLQAALALPAIHKLAIFEPPLFTNDSGTPPVVLKRYDQEMAQGKVAGALITAMQGGQMGPAMFNIMPRWLLELLVNIAMKNEDKKGSGEYVPMRTLAPVLHYDFQLVVEALGRLESFKAIHAKVLLLGGSGSPAYLKADLDALEKVLPEVRRTEFAGLGHGAAWNADRGGKPEPVAQELRRFFS